MIIFQTPKISKQYEKKRVWHIFVVKYIRENLEKLFKVCCMLGETKWVLFFKKKEILGVSKHFCFSLFCSPPGLSVVTCTISCWIRSRSRRPSLESKPIASTVCRYPISSFSFSSEPNSLKED